MPQEEKTPAKFTTVQLSKENHELAKELCPKGFIFKDWFDNLVGSALEYRKFQDRQKAS